jgi:hypothetical protein
VKKDGTGRHANKASIFNAESRNAPPNATDKWRTERGGGVERGVGRGGYREEPRRLKDSKDRKVGENKPPGTRATIRCADPLDATRSTIRSIIISEGISLIAPADLIWELPRWSDHLQGAIPTVAALKFDVIPPQQGSPPQNRPLLFKAREHVLELIREAGLADYASPSSYLKSPTSPSRRTLEGVMFSKP